MTIKFDEKARLDVISNIDEYVKPYNGFPISEMRVEPIKTSEARKYISAFHYTHTMPDSTRFCYAGYLGENLCGIATYGMGCGKNQYTALIPDIKNGQYIELTRLWCADDCPNNTESKLISVSLKMLPDEIKLVISFADSEQGHCGLIYQASNWFYCGMSTGGNVLVDSKGLKKHSRLLGIYKLRHPEYKNISNNELMDLLGYKYIKGGKKYRYVYLRGSRKEKKNNYLKIKEKILPYPKTNNHINISDSEMIKKGCELI